MYSLNWLKIKRWNTVIAYLAIFIIGFLDSIIPPDFSFSIFYIIPIALFALSKETKIINVIVLSLLSTFFWFYADYHGRQYETIFFPLWNSFVRLFIFLFIGIILLKYKENYKKVKVINLKLNQVNEEKNRFLGIAAHDLRSPIGMIIHYTNYLLDRIKPLVDKQEYNIIKTINNIGNNSLNLINNLLDISKIESGKLELTNTENEYISFLKEQIEYNKLIANNKNITIDFESKYSSVLVNFDKAYITQVINNLISNAIKFSNRESTIKVKVSPLPESMILTEVIDNGNGIKKDEQDILFDYFQKSSTRSTEGEINTGLGLAIVKKIILEHNGQVGVESEFNKGSRFYFLLPLNTKK